MQDIDELKAEFGDLIPYSKLLTCKEWHAKRSEIIIRDRKTCQSCGSIGFDDWAPKRIYRKGGILDAIMVPVNYNVTEVEVKVFVPTLGIFIRLPELQTVISEPQNPIFLHVHHKYYILTNYPWEYPDDALITLCVDCHKKIHEHEKIPVYVNELEKDAEYLTPCCRCNGQGSFEQYQHIADGICFRCGGAKYEELIRQVDVIDNSI